MKKVLAIVVACMYLAITSGLVLQIHYCMDKQVGSSVQFAEVNTRTCGICGMHNAKNKCCHDEVKFIKLQDVHQQATADYAIAPVPSVSQEFNLINISLLPVTDSVAACNNSPPGDDDDSQPSLFLFHHMLRI